ncbi:hypothetical protein Dda_8625 [Drechslerella dactyloides]|uniref:BZIP transcription factor n=1 Tax=Drechslerella dactyloides TaxID=74499 RepID=A0AAD6IQN0_DREDA|nr:hypothetical protein Dda_8625 [Drechslerella dactyloides]
MSESSSYIHFKRSESEDALPAGGGGGGGSSVTGNGTGSVTGTLAYSPHSSDIQDIDDAGSPGDQSPPGAVTDGQTPGTPQSQGGQPKKKTRSRTISSLTAEQLARKRAHDRDAQRAIRTRTKNQISALETRVKELEHEKNEWEFKYTELKKELDHALDALDAIKRNGLQPSSAASATSASVGMTSAPIGMRGPLGVTSGKPPVIVRGDPNSAGFMETNVEGGDAMALSTTGKESSAMSLDFVCHAGFRPNGYRQIQDQPYEYTSRKRSLADLNSSSSSDVSSDLLRRVSGAQSLLTSSPSSTVYSIPSVQYPGTYCVRANGHWEVMPRHLPPTCILDRVYLEFLEEQARLHRMNGTPLSVLAGPPQPDVTFIVSPGSRPPRNGLTQVMSAIVDTFGDLVQLPERLAIVYVLYIWMRWAINPTQESYDNMPEYVKPRPSQLFTARPIWFDHMPWPMTRDVMAKNPELYSNTEFSIEYTSSLSVNWPYDPVDTVMQLSIGEYVINPVFEAHIRKIENWSLGSRFVELYPDLAPHVRVVDHPPGKKFDIRLLDGAMAALRGRRPMC